MTREIKFRAWRKEKNDMIRFDLDGISREYSQVYEKGEFVTSVGGGSFVSDAIRKGFPIMQFTGLKDKNGKEIYEGDIVQNREYKPSIVEIKDLVWCGMMQQDEYWFDTTEIIGNIYEHPELINLPPQE